MTLVVIAAIVLGIFGGLWLSHAAKPELKQGKKWFVALLIISLSASIIVSLFFRNTQAYEPLVAACLFLATIVAISYRKA